MKVKCLILVVLLAFLAAGSYAQRKPSVYPGAVPFSPVSEMAFLINDSYDEVKAFYVKENGSPNREDDVGEQGKRTFFRYYARMPESDGVYIHYRSGRSKAVNRVLSEIRGLMTLGHISQEKFDETERRYTPYNNYFFLQKEDDQGNLVSVDELIYDKYHKKMGGVGETEDVQDMIKRAEGLIKSGRVQEGADLMKRAQQLMLEGAETAVDEEAVSIWLDCLEEIAANAYPVRINIQYFPHWE